MTLKNTLQGWKESIVSKAAEWSPPSGAGGVRNPHLWIVATLMVFGTFFYYIDQTPLVNVPPFDDPLFSTVHDLHRTVFLIPTIYAAMVFRIRGILIISLVLLGVVLPRALFFSPFSYALLRALLFVCFEVIIGLLVAAGLNRVESERKAYVQLEEAQRQLKENQAQLIQLEKLTSLGQLAASVAHEANNPISGVLIYTQLMIKKLTLDTLSKEKALEYLSRMESELTRTGRLIRNLLDFARQTEPSLRLVNLNEVIDRAFGLVAHSAEMQHVEVLRDLSPTLPEVMADPGQLQQVLTNLMLNAIQAMPQGGTLTLRSSADSEGKVKVEVQDTGVGISKGNMRKLFTPFFTTKKEVKGVGLGLAVSYGIIQRHRGRIEVSSEEGKGSTFTIYLNAYQGAKG